MTLRGSPTGNGVTLAPYDALGLVTRLPSGAMHYAATDAEAAAFRLKLQLAFDLAAIRPGPEVPDVI